MIICDYACFLFFAYLFALCFASAAFDPIAASLTQEHGVQFIIQELLETRKSRAPSLQWFEKRSIETIGVNHDWRWIPIDEYLRLPYIRMWVGFLPTTRVQKYCTSSFREVVWARMHACTYGLASYHWTTVDALQTDQQKWFTRILFIFYHLNHFVHLVLLNWWFCIGSYMGSYLFNLLKACEGRISGSFLAQSSIAWAESFRYRQATQLAGLVIANGWVITSSCGI